MEPFLQFYFSLISVLQGILQLAFSGWFTGSKPKFRHYLLHTLLFGLCNLAAAHYRAYLLPTLFSLLLLYGVNRFLLKNRSLVSCLTSILAVSILQLSFGTLDAMSSLALSHAGTGTAPFVLIGAAASLLSLALGCGGCYVTAHFFAPEKGTSHPFLFMLLAPSLLFFVIGFHIVNTVYGTAPTTPLPALPKKHLELLAIQLLGFCSLYSILYAYRRLCEGFRIKSKLILLEQETRAQKAYVAEARMRFEQTRAFRHDIKNHLSVLEGLLKAGQTLQAEAYLDKLGTVSEALAEPVRTGSAAADILLGSKGERARRNGIRTDFFFLLPQPCKIDELDLCVILSNALDNAIDACSAVDGPKSIRITGERQGGFYLLEFENTCLPEQSFVPAIGTGLSNIITVAEKYGGAVTMECRSGHFYLDVLLNIAS